jgi:hypothetical protein
MLKYSIVVNFRKSNYANFDQVYRKSYQHLEYQFNIITFIVEYIWGQRFGTRMHMLPVFEICFKQSLKY